MGDHWRKLRNRPTKLSQLWWWQHDNARLHVSADTHIVSKHVMFPYQQFMYSPDLKFCDRWMGLLKSKRILKQNGFPEWRGHSAGNAAVVLAPDKRVICVGN